MGRSRPNHRLTACSSGCPVQQFPSAGQRWRRQRLARGLRPHSTLVSPMILLMIFATLYTVVRFLLDFLATRFHPESELRIEAVALRHQLRVFQRQSRRPLLRPADRLLLTALGRSAPSLPLGHPADGAPLASGAGPPELMRPSDRSCVASCRTRSRLFWPQPEHPAMPGR